MPKVHAFGDQDSPQGCGMSVIGTKKKQPRSNSVSHGERLVFESLRDRIQMETTRASVLQTVLARSRLRFDIWKIV